jgi:hypothetical protein
MSHDPKPDKENMGPSTTPHNFLKLDQLQILKKKMGSHDSDEKLCSKSMDGKNPLRRFGGRWNRFDGHAIDHLVIRVKSRL